MRFFVFHRYYRILWKKHDILSVSPICTSHLSMTIFVLISINFKLNYSLTEIYIGLFFQPYFLEDRFARCRFFEARLLGRFFGFGFFGFTGVLNPCFSHVSKDSPFFSISCQCARVSVTRASFLFFVFLTFHTSVERENNYFSDNLISVFRVIFVSL